MVKAVRTEKTRAEAAPGFGGEIRSLGFPLIFRGVLLGGTWGYVFCSFLFVFFVGISCSGGTFFLGGTFLVA